MSDISTTIRSSERGGITILLALILLSAMTVGALALSQNSLREISITGNETTGRKAFEMADAGLDWVITWGSPNVPLQTEPARKALQDGMRNVLNAIDRQDLASSLVGTKDSTLNTVGDGYISPTNGTSRVYISSLDGTLASSELFPSTANYQQTGSIIQPAFDLEVRYLGDMPELNGGNKKRPLWLVRSVGRSNMGNTGQSFVSRRDTFVEYN
jgi:hypothetical protein